MVLSDFIKKKNKLYKKDLEIFQIKIFKKYHKEHKDGARVLHK